MNNARVSLFAGRESFAVKTASYLEKLAISRYDRRQVDRARVLAKAAAAVRNGKPLTSVLLPKQALAVVKAAYKLQKLAAGPAGGSMLQGNPALAAVGRGALQAGKAALGAPGKSMIQSNPATMSAMPQVPAQSMTQGNPAAAAALQQAPPQSMISTPPAAKAPAQVVGRGMSQVGRSATAGSPSMIRKAGSAPAANALTFNSLIQNSAADEMSRHQKIQDFLGTVGRRGGATGGGTVGAIAGAVGVPLLLKYLLRKVPNSGHLGKLLESFKLSPSGMGPLKTPAGGFKLPRVGAGVGAAAGGYGGMTAGKSVGGLLGGLAGSMSSLPEDATSPLVRLVQSGGASPKVEAPKPVPAVKPAAPVKQAMDVVPLAALIGGAYGAGNRPKHRIRGGLEGALTGGGTAAGASLGAGVGGLTGAAMMAPKGLSAGSKLDQAQATKLLLGALGGAALGGVGGGVLGNLGGKIVGRGVNSITGDRREDIDQPVY